LTAAAAVLALAMIASATAPRAEVLTATTQMSGKNEVPANDSKATGRARITFDTKTSKLSWNVTYRGIKPSAGHFHGPAAAGVNPGVVVPFASVDKSPVVGSATLTEAQAGDLLAGKWYVNLHTAAFGGGEIRGQVMPMPPRRAAAKSTAKSAQNAQ